MTDTRKLLYLVIFISCVLVVVSLHGLAVNFSKRAEKEHPKEQPVATPKARAELLADVADRQVFKIQDGPCTIYVVDSGYAHGALAIATGAGCK